MTLDQVLLAALGGSPIALVVAVALRIVWAHYQQALADREDLHAVIRDRDQSELDYLRQISRMGDSNDPDT